MNTGSSQPPVARRRALVIATHLRPSRDKRSSTYLMQPIAGLQVASLIDPAHFDVELYHEDWHGPFDTSRQDRFDLVFLSGLQVDFDRMRQLSYHFRRLGAKTVAGGSICTSFPEFASEYFDSVCAGGVDSVRDLIADFRAGAMKPIYRRPMMAISSYVVDHAIMARAGINPAVHLIEATRGCSFKCSFCVMPAEVGGHATHRMADVIASIEDSIASAPRFSFRRLWPMILFLDNNLSDDRAFLAELCQWMKAHPRIHGWAALVTQNILQDRALISELAAAKCIGLFAGIETLDPVMLKRFRKTQNLSKRSNVLDDIAFAESRGIGIAYGMLFDPRHQTADSMRQQVKAIAEDPLMPMPVYMSLIAPLAGTQSFWQDLDAGVLAPGLRLRDLDGETICYTGLADSHGAIAAFSEVMFRRPWEVIGRWQLLAKTMRRLWRSGSWNPGRWWAIAASNMHVYFWAKGTPGGTRSYRAGTDLLDPQYAEHPADLSAQDRARYFDPIVLIDDDGQPAPWLARYRPQAMEKFARSRQPAE